ncbi:MAG: hypothetical protein MUC56_03285 [Thermoanaerobaculales bacterium]|jgi:hypothetical protein|nr:hypothetical protein [Thermoanaerobaculales bacterium]
MIAAMLVAGAAVSADQGQVRARLVADASATDRSRSFHLGVLLEPEPGWHVYWRNPGGGGLATDVTFELPSGAAAGELGWPLPIAFEQPGGIPGYGYEGSVVLAAPVELDGPIAAPLPVAVTASWLACREICVLGSARLEAELPLGGEELAVSRAALAGWREQLPRTAEPPFGLTVTGGPLPPSGAGELVLWLEWPSPPPGAVELFPDPGPGLKASVARVRTRDRLTRIDLSATRLAGVGGRPGALPAVVVGGAADGSRTGWRVDIPID